MNSKTLPKLAFTVEQALEAASLPRTRFYELIADGSLKTFKIGRRRMVSQRALTDLIEHLEQDAEAAA